MVSQEVVVRRQRSKAEDLGLILARKCIPPTMRRRHAQGVFGEIRGDHAAGIGARPFASDGIDALALPKAAKAGSGQPREARAPIVQTRTHLAAQVLRQQDASKIFRLHGTCTGDGCIGTRHRSGVRRCGRLCATTLAGQKDRRKAEAEDGTVHSIRHSRSIRARVSAGAIDSRKLSNGLFQSAMARRLNVIKPGDVARIAVAA